MFKSDKEILAILEDKEKFAEIVKNKGLIFLYFVFDKLNTSPEFKEKVIKILE